ncbi:MAG: hypothetical protein HXY48_03690 [Ignavibacteriaceae bacterium]|nr:hypothetical protein [Ignavibacteriaceae bacterium]
MTFKEIFHFNNFLHKIKLDKSEENQVIAEQEKEIIDNDLLDEDRFSGNEWNQEYELIYLSYVLEK